MSEVAQTILKQLGGSRFLAMTGAKNLVGSDDGLHFTLGRNQSGANRCRITLNSYDLYDVEFLKFSPSKLTVTLVNNHGNVGCEDLRDIFERETGLVTSL